MRVLILTIMLLGIGMVVPANADNIDKAVDIVQRMCVAKSGSLEVEVEASGEFRLKRLLGAGVEASVSLSEKEVEGVLGKLDKFSAAQATQMRECMKPYIDKIIEKLIGGPDAGKKRDIVIKDIGSAFKISTFDRVMCGVVHVLHDRRFASERNVITVRHLESVISGINSLSIHYHATIGLQNGMFEMIDDNSFRITFKGVEYVTSKNLGNNLNNSC